MKLTAAFRNFVNVPKKKPKLNYPFEYFYDSRKVFESGPFGLFMSDLILFINDTFLVL